MELRLLLGVAPELEEPLALKEVPLLPFDELLDVDTSARFDELLLDEGPNLD